MIYLLQLLSLIEDQDLENFYLIFGDLQFEIDEMGYSSCPEDLVDDMLGNHFGLYLEDNVQLKNITNIMLNEAKFKAAITTTKLKRGLL